MANVKITDLTAYTDAASTDVLPIVDVASDVTKKVSISTLVKAVPAGTAAAPGIAIDGDPNTGVYSPGADQLSLSTGGIERFRIDSNGQLEAVSLGSAASPAYSFTTDPDTGIYSPGANQLALTTGGTGRLFVDANGRVGIATNTPAVSLDINNATGAYLRTGGATVALELGPQAGSNGPGIEYNVDGTTWIKGRSDAFPLAFRTNNLERLRIDSSGRVGIGVNSPANRLEVGGEVSPRIGINATGTASAGILFQGASTTYGSIVQQIGTGELAIKAGAAGQSAYFITFGTNDGTERARIDSSGRLLLGTSTARANFFNTTVDAALQIEGTASNFRMSLVRSSANSFSPDLILAKQRSGTVGGNTIVQGDDHIGRISFQGSDGTEFVETASINAFVDGTPGADDMPGRLVFSTTADGAPSPTERLRIDSTGQIEVAGLGSATAPAYSWLSDTNTGIYSPGADQLALATGGTGRLFVRSDGGVAINTALSPLDAQMQLAVGGSIGMLPATQDVVGTSNVVFRSSLGSASAESFIRHEITNFNNAANYGTALSFLTRTTTTASERLRIDSVGRLLLGTSSAVSTTYAGGGNFQIHSDGAATAQVFTHRSTGSEFPAILELARSRGSLASPTAVIADDKVGTCIFDGYDGANYIRLAAIDAAVDGTPGANSMPGRLVLSTTAPGASSPTERLRVDGLGRVGIGATAPSALLHLKGSPSAIVHLQPANDTVSNYITFRNAADATRGYVEYNYASDYLALATAVGERLRVDSSGRLLVGTSTALSYVNSNPTTVNPRLQLAGVGEEGSSFGLFHFTTGGTTRPSSIAFARSQNGTVGQQGIVADGARLGEVSFHGSDGIGFIHAANIRGEVDGAPGVNDMPGRLIFATTSDGASSPTERLRIDSTGQIEAAGLGSAAAPTYSWLSDTDSGLYSPGANQVALATSGVGRLFVGASGNIGVATNSPDVDLHLGITPASTGSAGILGFGDLGGYRFAQIEGFRDDGSYSGSLRFYTQPPGSSGFGGAERLRIDSSGNIGVGVTNPATSGFGNVIRNRASVGLGAAGYFAEGANSDTWLGLYSGTGTADSASIIYPSTGSLRIGTTTQVNATGYIERVRITSTGQVRLAGAGITFNGDTATANELDDYEEGTYSMSVTGTSGGSISFTSATLTYSKVGRVVFVSGVLPVSSSTAGGSELVATIPFALASVGSFGENLCLFFDTSAATRTPISVYAATTTALKFRLAAATPAAGDELAFSFSYHAA